MQEKDYVNMTTLCYIEKQDSYLMMHRISKKNDPNKDKWIGIGGHFKKGESPEECLVREVKEETGIVLSNYHFRGIITFVSDQWEDEYMHLFTANIEENKEGNANLIAGSDDKNENQRGEEITGSNFECKEGRLEWVPKEKIKELPLWEGDHIFLSLLNTRKTFFSLKLKYRGEKLVQAVLDGHDLKCQEKSDM